MKQIIFIVLLWMSCTFIFAQDIIVTKQSEKIEAKITDVEQDFIKYKKFNYQEGPTYTIKKSEIVSIIYQNGDVETFAEQQPKPSDVNMKSKDEFIEGQCKHISFTSKAIKYSGYVIGDFDGLSESEIGDKIQAGELVYFTVTEFRDYIKKFDPEAYKKFRQGSALQIVGFTTIFLGYIVGFPAVIAGAAMGGEMTTVIIGSVGLVLASAVGIPVWFAGTKTYTKKVPELYNSHVNRTNRTSLSWNVGLVGNGVGLQLKF